MKAITSLLARSLGARLFLLCGALVLGVVLAALGFTALRANQVADQSVRESLAASASARERFERQRTAQLRLMARFAAGDPTFVAYIAESDPGSVRDLLLQRQRELECDLLVVLDRRGKVLARTDRTGGVGEDASGEPLLADLARRGEASGLWTDGERFWTAVAVPVLSGAENPEGVLIAGLALDDALALDVGRQSGAEVAYVALGRDAHVIASTLADDRSLLTALAGGRDLIRRALEPDPGGPLQLTVGGRRWVLRAAELEPAAADRTGSVAAGARPQVAVVTLASLDQALAPFRRIEAAQLWVGLISMGLAFALSYALSRRVTGPIERLADVAEAARAGRFDQPVPSGGADEVGRLARAFEGLMAELKEEREMEAYLQTISRALPDVPPAPPSEAAIAPPGTLIAGRFEVLSWVGSGASGVVYKAHDRELDDVVALKTLRREATTQEALEGLKGELRLARRITHRHVLRTHDFGEAGEIAFISMEFVRGLTLRPLLLATRRLPASVALRLARQLASGLAAAHALGVIHRDIKPENLIVDPTGQLKIMDFGIARALHAGGAAAEGGLSGTPGYLAPEQLVGQTGDARSDIYAVGVVLYEALGGRRPFLAVDVNELAYRVANEAPPPLGEVAPEVRPEVARLVMRCLARDPAARPADAATLERELGELRA